MWYGFRRRRLFGLLVAASYRRRGRRSRSSGSAAPDYVYVIKGEHGRVKIGSSVDPDQRCAELQTGSPFRLWVEYRIAVTPPAAFVEHAAHDMLDAHRGSGEWFAVPTEAAIAAIHAAAYKVGARIGVGPITLHPPNWLRRVLAAAALASPFWLCLGLGLPLPAVACLIMALAWFLLAFARTGLTAGEPMPQVARWIGTAAVGCTLPIVPALVLSALIGTARAAEAVPTYDSEKFCSNLAAFSGGQQIIKTGCMSREGEYRGKVDRVWPTLSERIRSDCIKTVALSVGSYQGLGGCLSLIVGNKWLDGEMIATPVSK